MHHQWNMFPCNWRLHISGMDRVIARTWMTIFIATYGPVCLMSTHDAPPSGRVGPVFSITSLSYVVVHYELVTAAPSLDALFTQHITAWHTEHSSLSAMRIKLLETDYHLSKLSFDLSDTFVPRVSTSEKFGLEVSSTNCFIRHCDANQICTANSAKNIETTKLNDKTKNFTQGYRFQYWFRMGLNVNSLQRTKNASRSD